MVLLELDDGTELEFETLGEADAYLEDNTDVEGQVVDLDCDGGDAGDGARDDNGDD